MTDTYAYTLNFGNESQFLPFSNEFLIVFFVNLGLLGKIIFVMAFIALFLNNAMKMQGSMAYSKKSLVESFVGL
jgi:hypothetical protein